MRFQPRVLGCALAAAIAGSVCNAPAAGQIDTAAFMALARGMPESEVYYRVGLPDRVTVHGADAAHVAAQDAAHKRLHYIPSAHEHDPHLTVITVRNGRVFALERSKLLTRPPAVVAPAPASTPAGEDVEHAIRTRRADRTVEAAQRYAEVRARIKAQQAAAAASGPGRTTMFRGTDEAGVPYFGDRPPRD